MADDFEAAGVLDSLNRAGQGTWHLVCRLRGGRKTGAWVVEDREGVRAVLKWHPKASTRWELDGTAALVARARARGWPTPAWLAWGLDGWRRPYVLAELVAGEVLDAMDDVALDALLAVLERQRGLAGTAGADLVHMDFGLHNVLFRSGEVAAVVDLEGVGRGRWRSTSRSCAWPVPCSTGASSQPAAGSRRR